MAECSVRGIQFGKETCESLAKKLVAHEGGKLVIQRMTDWDGAAVASQWDAAVDESDDDEDENMPIDDDDDDEDDDNNEEEDDGGGD